MKIELLKLDLFDGEGGDPAPGTETAADKGADVQGELPLDDNSVYDRPSPLLFSGVKDEEPADDGGAAGGDNPASGDAAQNGGDEPTKPGASQEPAAPFKVLRYRGQDIPVQSEQELIELASQGIDYTRKTQQIAPYRNLIERLESDRLLMSKVVDMVNGGGQFQQPERPEPQKQRQQASQQQRGPQPVWDAGETYEEFNARRAAWESGQTDGQPQNPQKAPQQEQPSFQQQFDQAVLARQMQATAQALAQRTMQDERHEAVLDAISGLPREIIAAMNSNPVAYQMVYDQVRSNIVGEAFFAKPQNQPNTQNAPSGTQNAAAKQAPFTEQARGQKGPATGKQPTPGLPDFWKMSDKDFENFSERQRFK